MDTDPDTKKEDFSLPKPKTGSALIEEKKYSVQDLASRSVRHFGTQIEAARFIRDAARFGRTIIPLPPTGLGTAGIPVPSSGQPSVNPPASDLLPKSSTSTKPNTATAPVITSIPIPKSGSPTAITTIASAATIGPISGSVISDTVSQTSLSQKLTNTDIALPASSSVSNPSPTPSGELKSSEISSVQSVDQLSPSQQTLLLKQLLQSQKLTAPPPLARTSQSSSVPLSAKRQRQCPPDSLDHALRVSSAARGLRGVKISEADSEDMVDGTRSDPDVDSGDDLSDLEEEEDPRAVSIDEKCTALVSAVKGLTDGVVALHKKFDLLADSLTRFVQSQQKLANRS